MPVPSLELVTSGPDDTRAFAAAMAPLLQLGDVVALSGDLGAGKTCFVQGAVRGLGVEARVTSPTFVLVRQYAGRLPIVHCDVYRLDRLQDVHDLGDDVLAPEVVTFLEWADAIRPLLPDDRLEVDLTVPVVSRADPSTSGPSATAPGARATSATGPSRATTGDAEVAVIEEQRTATVRGFGPRWAERAEALTETLRPWLTSDDPGSITVPGTAPAATRSATPEPGPEPTSGATPGATPETEPEPPGQEDR